jgi:flagellar hook-associated protein 3 FlgL
MLRLNMVPSLLLTGAAKASISRTQVLLFEAQREVSTGRHHDLGLVLGSRTGTAIGLRMRYEEIVQAGEAGARAAVMADVTQSTLTAVDNLASNFLSVLTGARGAVQGQQLVSSAAREALESLAGLINSSFDGQYLFGGINSDTAPLVAYRNGTPEAAVTAAFHAAFGMLPDDPAVSGIAASEMEAFISGSFAAVFADPAWGANWSNASTINKMQRLGDGQQVGLSSNANDLSVRKLARAFSMMTGLGQGNLSQAAFEKTVDAAISLLSEAKLAIGGEQSRLGIAQQTLALSLDSAGMMKAAAAEAIAAMESVDPYEAATRVNVLMSQLESSYAVTGRISRMSLLNYI